MASMASLCKARVRSLLYFLFLRGVLGGGEGYSSWRELEALLLGLISAGFLD